MQGTWEPLLKRQTPMVVFGRNEDVTFGQTLKSGYSTRN